MLPIDLSLLILTVTAGGGLEDGLFAAFAGRFALVFNALLNEWGHVVVGLGLGAGRRAWNAPNLLGHRAPWLHFAALLPFVPDRRGDLTVHIPGLDADGSRLARRGGFWLSALLSVAAAAALCSLDERPNAASLVGYCSGALVALLGAAASDLAARSPYAAACGLMACGNVTLMGRLLFPEQAALPGRARELLRSMLRVSQMRGAQSGGGAVQIQRGSEAEQVIAKYVNAKRGDLGAELTRVLARSVRSRRAFGGAYLVQCHVRYATAGLTSKHEAHPFRFVEVAARGPRRIRAWGADSERSAWRSVQTALTHNGDMDGLRFRGVSLPFPDLGYFLERVLGVQNRWVGDSPLLAAAVELYLTRGSWFESLRLAYQITVAPPPPDVRKLPAGLGDDERKRESRALFAAHPALSPAVLSRWEAAIGQWLSETPGELAVAAERNAARQERERLVGMLVERFRAEPRAELPVERQVAFVRAAVDAFFDNDLYIALRKLEPGLEGTFGCVITSTLEPGCLVAMSRGQPLSLGFQRDSGTVCVVSERAALKVRDATGQPAFHERLDLDLCSGEIARVSVQSEGPIALSLYGVVDGRERGSEELYRAGRLVPLRGNPYVARLPDEPRDRVEADLQALPGLLAEIRSAWGDPSSSNVATATDFAAALFGRERPRVLLLGITNELWLAEQFAQNLRALFPHVVAEARSSNDVLLEGTESKIEPDTVVLALSQSGQDFPTLGALVLALAGRRQDRSGVFVLTGELDSLMGQAVGQSYARDAPFSRRIFANGSGFRPSEAALATVSATQHTLVELCLFLARYALDTRRFRVAPLGMTLTREELHALERRRDLTVEQHAPILVGTAGGAMRDALQTALARQARRWTWHVLEGATAFVVVVGVLEANLQFHLGILPSRVFAWLAQVLPVGAATVPRLLGAQADVLFYALLAPLAIWALRALQGRPLFHRQGTRELLIGDRPHVHRILWLLARKLFSLSYGFASIRPYSANSQDELVLTHEPVRGTLALIGIPDSRRRALERRSAAAQMSARQFAYSRSLAGAGAEIVTVSHAPRGPGAAIGTHLALPGPEPAPASAIVDELIENMFDSWERLLAMQVLLERLARAVARPALARFDHSRTKDQVFAPTTAAPVSAAEIYQLLSRAAERYDGTGASSLPFELVQSEWRGSAPPVRTTVWRDDST